VLEAFHRLLAIDENGIVNKVVRTLGTCWGDTDPNGTTPWVRRAKLAPAYPRSRRERPMLESVVASHCVRKDGLAASSGYAVGRALDDLVGDDTRLRDGLRPVIGAVVKKVMKEDAQIQLERLAEEGAL
jgi:hypothetical protein